MTEQLECGHPKACYVEDEGCEWCDEVESLKRQAQSYREQLHKKAVVLTPGEYDLRTEEIGLLEVTGGRINILQTAGAGRTAITPRPAPSQAP